MFEKYLEERAAWSIETFGPLDHQRDTRAAAISDHIRKELLEIERSPHDLEEWIDVISLALDGALRCAGAASTEILPALRAKLERCKNRTWPDWRTHPPGHAVEHVRAPHRAQRVTAADLAAVRAQELADFAPSGATVAVSEPVSIREMPALVAPQPAPTASRGREIWPLVIADMTARDAMGREKYGHPLRANNGRRPLVDAYQEALDLAVYLRQEIEERKEEPTWQQTAENLRGTVDELTAERDQLRGVIDTSGYVRPERVEDIAATLPPQPSLAEVIAERDNLRTEVVELQQECARLKVLSQHRLELWHSRDGISPFDKLAAERDAALRDSARLAEANAWLTRDLELRDLKIGKALGYLHESLIVERLPASPELAVDLVVEGCRKAASIAAELSRIEKLFDDAGENTYNVLALVDHYAAQAAAGQEAQRTVCELRDLMTVDNDGPEGSMSSRWILGQVREILGMDAPVAVTACDSPTPPSVMHDEVYDEPKHAPALLERMLAYWRSWASSLVDDCGYDHEYRERIDELVRVGAADSGLVDELRGLFRSSDSAAPSSILGEVARLLGVRDESEVETVDLTLETPPGVVVGDLVEVADVPSPPTDRRALDEALRREPDHRDTDPVEGVEHDRGDEHAEIGGES